MRKNRAYHHIIRLVIIIIVTSLTYNCKEVTSSKSPIQQNETIKIDSISILINQSKTLNNKERKIKLLQAYKLNNNKPNDTIKTIHLRNIAYEFRKIDDSILFKKTNTEAYELAKQISDTLIMGRTHWNFAMFYEKREVMDSAYYHFHTANKYFKAIHHEYFSAKMLFNMSFIQSRFNDYTGSELLVTNAIKKYKALNEDFDLYKCYNSLGLIYAELEEYEKSIESYNKALEYLKKTKLEKGNRARVLNNLGLAYEQQRKHNIAITYYTQVLNETKYKDNPRSYARVIDNLAYNRFLNEDTIHVEKDMQKALYIRDSMNIIAGVALSKLHLAEFYSVYNDTTKAIAYAKDASNLAKETNNNRDHLAALQLLSKIDKPNAPQYLNNYIVLTNSLQAEERKIRNKFTKIRFDTDEHIEEAERLAQQRIRILIGSLAIISIVLLLYFVKRQHSKNKELLLEKEQQKANQEIYALLLKQHEKLEEGRLQERTRISEELHDGVLGNLFGTRLGLSYLNLNSDKETLTKHDTYIESLQQIEREIRGISHELKNEILSTKLNYITLIEDLLKTQSAISGFEYTINSDDTIYWDEIDEKIRINCYRVIQEAIQNINKYAKAKKVVLDFKKEDKMLNLTIKDDGKGFNIKAKKIGIGLKNMNDRITRFNGKFDVESQLDKGTTLNIAIPV